MRLLPRKTISRLFGGLTGLLIVLGSSAVIAQTQPERPLRDGLPRLPRLTLTAQDEYVIRENLLTDSVRHQMRERFLVRFVCGPHESAKLAIEARRVLVKRRVADPFVN